MDPECFSVELKELDFVTDNFPAVTSLNLLQGYHYIGQKLFSYPSHLIHPTNTAEDLSNVGPHLNIKSLQNDLDLAFTKTLVTYFMENFPSLEELKMPKFVWDPRQLSKEDLNAFIQHIVTNVKQYDITTRTTNRRNNNNTVATLASSIISNSASIIDLMDLSIEYNFGVLPLSYVNARNYRSGADGKTVYDDNGICKVQTCFLKSFDRVQRYPHQDIIEQAGKHITMLSFGGTKEADYDRWSNMSEGEFHDEHGSFESFANNLHHIITHCTNLNMLNAEYMIYPTRGLVVTVMRKFSTIFWSPLYLEGAD